MPKFDVQVMLDIKANFTRLLHVVVDAPSEEEASDHVAKLLDELEEQGSCADLEKLNDAFANPLDFDKDDWTESEIDFLDIGEVREVQE